MQENNTPFSLFKKTKILSVLLIILNVLSYVSISIAFQSLGLDLQRAFFIAFPLLITISLLSAAVITALNKMNK